MTVTDLSEKTNDFDTVGGRLSRARDAINLPLEQVAELVGVEDNTLKAWECDQALPRSNRITMLAGILGVSASWLLFGRGSSPNQEATPSHTEIIELQIHDLKLEYQKIGSEIKRLEESLNSPN